MDWPKQIKGFSSRRRERGDTIFINAELGRALQPASSSSFRFVPKNMPPSADPWKEGGESHACINKCTGWISHIVNRQNNLNRSQVLNRSDDFLWTDPNMVQKGTFLALLANPNTLAL